MAESESVTSTLAIAVGIVLVVLGVGSYVVSDFASVTALIPAIFGIVFVGLGLLGRETGRTDVATYGIGILALLGILGSVQAIPDLIALLTGDSVDSSIAVTTQTGMIVLCLVLLGAVVKTLLDDR